MLEYRITYLDTQRASGDENNQTRGVSIFDTTDSSSTVVELRGTGSPDGLQIIDNSEDIFTPIRARQLNVQFISTQFYGAHTFVQGEDDRWLVKSWIGDVTKVDFTGFLVTDGMQRYFQPHPTVVQLTASDKIPSLKEQALTDENDLNPQGKWRIAQYISWCLRKTGLDLPIYVVNNIRHGSKVRTSLASFTTSSGEYVILTATTDFFYPGQIIQVSGTASNNIIFTVKGTGLLIVQITLVNEATVLEENVTATFTDVSEGHLYDKIYLDARTFEREIGVSEDCDSVLRKILGEDCFIQQAKNAFWIKRIDEYETGDFKPALFDSDGTFNSFPSDVAHSKNVGRTETIKFANADAIVRYRRPYAFVKLTFKFEYPLEIPCNSNWSRGTLIPTTVDDEVLNDISYPALAYAPECWTYYKGYPNLTQDSVGYIKRFYKNSDELGHYLHAEETLADAFYYWQADQRVPMNQGDKFVFNVDVRYGTDLGGGAGSYTLQHAHVRLYGNDGTFWTLQADYGSGNPDAGPIWVPSASNWIPSQPISYTGEASATDHTQWQNVSGESAPLPVAGELEILLLNNFQSDDQSKSFTNFKIEYIPLINGTYATYTGQYHQVSQTGAYKANRDKQVYMSDSVTQLQKGAMFTYSGTKYFLASRFYDSLKDPSATVFKPFGEWQSQAVWNQFNKEGRIVSGSLRGLDSDILDGSNVDVPEPIHKYFLTDADNDTTNKTFVLISYDKDNKSQIWSGVFIEVYDSVAGKVIGTHLFAYTMKQ